MFDACYLKNVTINVELFVVNFENCNQSTCNTLYFDFRLPYKIPNHYNYTICLKGTDDKDDLGIWPMRNFLETLKRLKNNNKCNSDA
jgi:hypothetical protein